MSEREVFLDTSGIIALEYKGDQWHERAVGLRDDLKAQRVRLVTTDDVLVEVSNYFADEPKHGGWQRAVAVIRTILASVNAGAVDLVYVDKGLFEEAWEMMQTYRDKEWGLTDCGSFAVMKNRRIRKAFAADRHFEQAGFELLLCQG